MENRCPGGFRAPAWTIALPPTPICTRAAAEAAATGGQEGGPASSSSSSTSIPGLLPEPPLSTDPPTGSAAMHISFLLALFVLLAGTDARQPRSHSSRPHRHPHCFHADELQNGEVPPMFRARVARWRRHTALPTASSLEGKLAAGHRQRRHQEPTCADLKFQDLLNKDVNERSISPWKYNIVEDADRYPPRLAFAECLCRGCIDLRSGQESFSLNSMPVHQSVMVLRRKACQREDDTPGFSFEVQYLSVPVACACVLPRSSS